VFDLININVVSNSKKKDKYNCRKVIEAANVILANVAKATRLTLGNPGDGGEKRAGWSRPGRQFFSPRAFCEA